MVLRTSLADVTKRASLADVAKTFTGQAPTALGSLERYGRQLFSEGGTDIGAERQIINDAQARTRDDVAETTTGASDLTRRAFTSSRGTLERQTRALGATQTARGRESQDRRLGLAQVLSDVDSRNRALQADQSRREQLRLQAGSLRDIIENSALGGLTSAANAEGRREQEYQQALAEYDANKNAALGNVIGIGLNFVPGLGMVNNMTGNQIGQGIAGALG